LDICTGEKEMKKLIIAIAAVVITTSIMASLASAQSGSGIAFELSPSDGKNANFVFDLEPGSSIEDTLTISNHGEQSVTVNLYPADASTGAAGGVVVSNESEMPELLGSWIRLEREQVEVPAHSAINVDFSIVVPASPPAGKLAAGIVAQDVNITEGTSALSVSSVQRSVVMILATAPGELIPDLQITNVTTGHTSGMPSFGIELTNEGTTYVRPEGRLIIESKSGELITELPITLGLFMPRTNVTHRVRTGDFLDTGEYVVDIELDFGSSAPAVWRTEFKISNDDVEKAIAQANLAAEAGETEPPVIVVQQSGTDPVIAIAGISVVGILGSAIVFLLFTRRKGNPTKIDGPND
jgi:hypothetical protein